MRKLIIFAIIIVLSLASCGDGNVGDGRTIERYLIMRDYYESELGKDIYDKINSVVMYDYSPPASAAQIVDISEYVFTARISDVSFENVPENGFRTVYSVEILKTYKGDTSGITTLFRKGGLVGYRTDDQLAVLGGEKIPIYRNYMRADCHLGETYLFALGESLYIYDPSYEIFDMSDPDSRAQLGALTANEVINECRFDWLRIAVPIASGVVAVSLVALVILKSVKKKKTI